MASLFTVVILISLVAAIVFFIKSLKAKSDNKKKQLKFAGISLVVGILALAGVGVTAPDVTEGKTTKSDTYELSSEEIELLDKLDASLIEEERKVTRGNTLDGILSVYQGIKIKRFDDQESNLTITARMDELDRLPIGAKDKTKKMLSALKNELDFYNINGLIQFNWTLFNEKLNVESIYYIIRFDAETIKNTDWSTVRTEELESLASYVSNDIINN